MKFQYIRASFSPQGRTYLMPETLTRYYYRKDIVLEHSDHTIEIDYPFAFELFIDGQLIPARTGEKIHFLPTAEVTKIAIRAYLSNTPLHFLPALHAEIACGGKLIAQTDKTWGAFTFAAFYTEKEAEGWQTGGYTECYAKVCDVSPCDILRSHYFRKVLEFSEKPETAVAEVTARGFYRLYVNGKDILGDTVLSPGVNIAPVQGFPYESAKCDLYQEYDLAPYLREGKNEILLLSGNGWYASEGFNVVRVAPNEVAMNLHLSFGNGRRLIRTDATWETAPSPLLENDLQWGERWDARLDIQRDKEAAQAVRWTRAVPTDTAVTVRKQNFPAVKVVEEIEPIADSDSLKGEIFDFGENMAGRGKLVVQGARRGQILILHYGERRLPNGELCGGPYHDVYFAKDTHADGVAQYGARSFDVYVCSGAAQEIYEPSFAFTGFRYIELIGAEGAEVRVTARKMRTADSTALQFSSDNFVLNGIYEMCSRSILANTVCGPIDCPTREKNFWNGDACIIAPSSVYLTDCYDTLRYWTKWGRKINSDAVCWRDEEYILPYVLYQTYGKKQVLRENFAKIQALAEQRIAATKDDYFDGEGLTFFGDYAYPPRAKAMEQASFSHLWYCRMLDIVGKICAVLGKDAEQERYFALLSKAKCRYREIFYEKITENWQDKALGEFIFPLAFGILDSEDARVYQTLLGRRLEMNGYTVDCGAASAAELLPVLCDAGMEDAAYAVAVNQSYPSWGSMYASGATTVTEYWEGMNSSEEGDSLNHQFKASPLRWIVEYIGGIRPAQAGFRRLQVSPVFPAGLREVSVSYRSCRGVIRTAWKRRGNEVEITVFSAVAGDLLVQGKRYSIHKGENRWVIPID